MSVAQELLAEAGGNKTKAATALVLGVMRGDPDTFKLGYSIGNALLTAVAHYNLTAREVCLVVEEVSNDLRVHHSSSRRPLVIVNVGGGLVQGTVKRQGIGTPRVYVLDYDKEGCTPDELAEFIDDIQEARNALMEYDPNESLYVQEMDESITDYREMLVWPQGEDGPPEFSEVGGPSRYR